MEREVTTRELAKPDWLTLREVARVARVSADLVRQWCVRYREGKPGGLKYSHFGAAPESEAARTNYRVHVDDWRAFEKERRREEAKEDRRERQWVENPISYV